MRETVKLKCHTFNFPPLHRTAPDMGTKGRDWHCPTKTDDHDDDEARLAALALVSRWFGALNSIPFKFIILSIIHVLPISRAILRPPSGVETRRRPTELYQADQSTAASRDSIQGIGKTGFSRSKPPGDRDADWFGLIASNLDGIFARWKYFRTVKCFTGNSRWCKDSHASSVTLTSSPPPPALCPEGANFCRVGQASQEPACISGECGVNRIAINFRTAERETHTERGWL